MSAAALGATLAIASPALADPDADTVFLNAGGRIRGSISVDDPKDGITIVLANGTVRRIKRAEVKRVVYGAEAAAPVAPVAPVAAVPPGAPGEGSAVPMAPAGPSAPYAAYPPYPPYPPYAPNAPYAPGPPMTGPRTTNLRGLWITSLVIGLTAYAATVIATAVLVATENGQPYAVGIAAIPVVGPFIGIGVGNGALTGAETGALVASGVVQSLSLVGVIVGLSVHTDSGVAAAPAPPRWTVLPSVAPHYGGVTATVFAF